MCSYWALYSNYVQKPILCLASSELQQASGFAENPFAEVADWINYGKTQRQSEMMM